MLGNLITSAPYGIIEHNLLSTLSAHLLNLPRRNSIFVPTDFLVFWAFSFLPLDNDQGNKSLVGLSSPSFTKADHSDRMRTKVVPS